MPRRAQFLLGFIVIPLMLGAGGVEFSAVADTHLVAAKHHAAQSAPGQRWGSAGGEKHIVAKGSNHTVPASVRSRYPLWTAPKAPSIQPNSIEVTSAPASATESTFDVDVSTELPTHRTANERVYQNPDDTLTTEFSPTPINYQKADGSWAKIDTVLERDRGWTSAKGPVDVHFAASADETVLVLQRQFVIFGRVFANGARPPPMILGCVDSRGSGGSRGP